MLKSIVITLRPTEESVVPAYLGHAVQGWFLNLVRSFDASLSAAIHADNQPRPYTVSGLVGGGPTNREGQQLSPERTGWIRITSLIPELSTLMGERIVSMLPSTVMALTDAYLRVESVAVTSDEHPWAGEVSPQQLVVQGSLDPHLERRVNLRFASPTTFRSEGMNVPFPLPDLVFGSLLDKWNMFSEVTLHPDARRFADAQVAASKYDLRTRYVSFLPNKGGGAVGCVGKCRYVIRGSDKYWLGVIRTLAAYAFFAGVGARTAMGFGQAALWDEANSRPVDLHL